MIGIEMLGVKSSSISIEKDIKALFEKNSFVHHIEGYWRIIEYLF